MNIELTIDSHQFKAWLSAFERKQVPFATSIALNNTAFACQKQVKAEMGRVFDAPTPFTINSIYVKKSKKTNLVAKVYVRDSASKGTPPSKYLKAEVEGGKRHFKRSEKALQMRGMTKSSDYLMPGNYASRDQYGNMRRGEITKILSGIGGFTEQGYDANATGSRRSKKKGNAKRYAFIKPRGGNRPIAIYERAGKSLKPILFIQRKEPRYKKRLNFYRIVESTANTRIQYEFMRAMKRAIETAR